jgi:hypothetical protein
MDFVIYNAKMFSFHLEAVWFLLRTNVSEKSSATIIRMTRIGEVETTLAVTSNRHTPHISSQCASVSSSC